MELTSKRIVVTRPKSQAGDFARQLQALGAIPIFFPVIQISAHQDTSALDQALRQLDRYNWLVLTSVNGVQIVWERMAALHITKLPQQLKIAAIGPKTAAALAAEGVQPDFIPTEYIAEAILPGLGDLKGQSILLLRADIARPALPQAISNAGGLAYEVSVYSTHPTEPDLQALHALRQGVDVITLTSSSIVRNFVNLVRQSGLDPLLLPGKPLFACIGPVTAATASEEGLPVHLVASEYTTDGLIKSLLEFDARETIQ